jgi:hypothetical protein
MGEDFETLLHAAEEAEAGTLDIERLWQRLINDLESDSDLFVPVEVMSAALSCLDRNGRLDERLAQAIFSFVERTGLGDYAVAFNAQCEDHHNNLYVELPQTMSCQASTECYIPQVKPYGLYYIRRRLSEQWASPEVSPPRVATLLTSYLAEFKKARATDGYVADLVSDMYEYGYLDELCQAARASRTRSDCPAVAEAKKVVAAEQALARSLNEAEFALVSFLTQHLSEHKTLCLREYNRKEQDRKVEELARLQEGQNEDRDDYGQILRLKKSNDTIKPPGEPDKSDLAVLKRPYWMYCEKNEVHYWVGDKPYRDFIIGYTSDAARKLRFGDDPGWRKVDLDIAHGRLQSFKWHNPVEAFIEVQQATNALNGVTKVPQQVPEAQPTRRRVGYTLESIADRLRQEQDAVMRTSPVGITLIAGTAGSGKTNVAFHRIDYLLQEHHERFSQGNIAVFAPKVSITKYLGQLAASLRLWSLPIYDYDDWVMGILSDFTDVNRVASEEDAELCRRKCAVGILDLLLRYMSDKAYQFETEVKNDVRLQAYAVIINSALERPPSSLIGRYTALRNALWTAIDIEHEQDGAVVRAQRTAVEASFARMVAWRQHEDTFVDDLEHAMTETFHSFPGFKKEYALAKTKLDVYRPPLSRIQRVIWLRAAWDRTAAIEAVLAQFVDVMFSEKRIDQLVSRRIRAEKNRINARLRAIFKRTCFIGVYPHPPAHLVNVCETPFQLHVLPMLTEFYRTPYCWDYLGLAETPEHPFGVFELTKADVDVVMWLLYQISRENLAGEPTSRFLHVYDHVVVDEAQDFTPLQLLLLHRLSHNSMTLSGDLTQRIFPMGIHDWNELGEPIDHHWVLTMSHRTTLETALFANALLHEMTLATPAERVAYHGERPLVVQCQDDDGAVTAAVDYIKDIKNSDAGASVLLVHPRNGVLRNLRDRLTTIGIAGYVAKGDTWEFSEKVAVTTYRRVQGLEYDYVIVLGLNDFETMPISGDKSRILYTLATRAKKRLVFYVVKPIPTLLTNIDSTLYDLG